MNIKVTFVPGACAAIAALALSGLFTGRFAFEGFLPYQKKERKEKLEEISQLPYTIIMYEAPHKLIGTLEDLNKALSNRKIALCRELTKLNEEIIRTTIEDALVMYGEKAPRGEYVLIIEGNNTTEKENQFSSLTIQEHVELYISDGMSKMDAIKKVAKERNIPKNEVYSVICK